MDYDLSSKEKKVFSRIKSKQLNSCVIPIREAAEAIWTPEVRVIKDYTDHGILHSQRIIDYLSQLSSINRGKALSEIELFVLLISTYLHDIGMQCDPIQFPEIKSKAEEIGAKFDVAFSAESSSSFSIEEQKAIRVNHSYLTAAWIDYAFQTEETILGESIKRIPPEFIGDIRDVCLYHSGLSIGECPSSFELKQGERKQFVASVLRFSDELDIDANRVSIETVKLFRLAPDNAFYWWIHNLTSISLESDSLINISIRLHTDDFEEYRSYINTKFIGRFASKNRLILDILARHGIVLRISSDSGAVSHAYTEKLPPEIHSILIDGKEEIKEYDTKGLELLGALAFSGLALASAKGLKSKYHSKIPPGPKQTLSVDQLIGILNKFTSSKNSPVMLNAKIVPFKGSDFHSLFIWGVRDTGLRKKEAPRYLPGHQEAAWSCILEDALRYGILPEQVTMLRDVLKLQPKDGITDDYFFKIDEK